MRSHDRQPDRSSARTRAPSLGWLGTIALLLCLLTASAAAHHVVPPDAPLAGLSAGEPVEGDTPLLAHEPPVASRRACGRSLAPVVPAPLTDDAAQRVIAIATHADAPLSTPSDLAPGVTAAHDDRPGDPALRLHRGRAPPPA